METNPQTSKEWETPAPDPDAALGKMEAIGTLQLFISELPEPVALDITLPERGKVVTFTRSIQVGGSEEPMEIDIALQKTNRAAAWLAIPLCLLLGGLAASRARKN